MESTLSGSQPISPWDPQGFQVREPMKINHLTKLATLVAALSCSYFAAAQPIALTGTSYTQNFDDLGNGLPGEWYLYTGASGTASGNLYAWANVNQTAASNAWRTVSGRFSNQASYTCWGTNFVGDELAAVQAEATNRALGLRQVSATDTGPAFVLKIQDTIGKANFALNVDFLNLDPTSPRSNTWTIDYAVGATPGAFVPLAWFTNSSLTFFHSNITVAFGSALDAKPETVWLRIAALQATSGSGNRRTFGIDNFNLTWENSTVVNPVEITTQPQARTNNAGSTAAFTVAANGTNPSYQWRKGTTALVDDGFRIIGANTPALQIRYVLDADEGDYNVVVNNTINSQTSQSAKLTVIDPAVTAGPTPASKTVMPGDTGNFLAVVWGTDPVTFQWQFNGVGLPGATDFVPTGTNYSSTLYVTNAQANKAGSYTLAVSSTYGNSTSAPAVLTVLSAPTNLLARWDFNNTNDVATGPAPAIGSGSATTVGGNNAYFPAGTFSDPAIVLGFTNGGWNTQYYPSNAGESNKQAGVEFRVSTAGQKDIMVAWEERHSNTASKYQRFQYSTDGINFVDGPVMTYAVTDNSFVLFSVDLSGIAGVSKNPNFAFRIVTEWESTATGAGVDRFVGTTSYGGGLSGGTIRYDLMTIYGNTAPAGPDAIPLAIQNLGSRVVLSWADPAFSLASSPDITGSYQKIAGAVSPYTNTVSGDTKYFRLVYP